MAVQPNFGRMLLCRRLAPALLAVVFIGCSINNAKRSYVVAERFWSEGKYEAAVAEFERVYAKDSGGPLGQQALFRAATTQGYFLSQYSEALKKLRLYAESNRSTQQAWDAQKIIGDFLFSKMDQYDLAQQHYRNLVAMKPDAPEIPEFIFKTGKSFFYMSAFDEALKEFKNLARQYPKSVWAEKAAYEVGVTLFTRGEQLPDGRGPGSEAYQDAIDAYEAFIKKYPKSEWVAQAKFGIAACLEEMDQLNAAYHAYEELKGSYPSPNVIEIKLVRIRERKAQKSR